MWILNNSKDLLEYIQSRSLSLCYSIKTLKTCLHSTLCIEKHAHQTKQMSWIKISSILTMSVAENFLLESGLFYFCKISGLFLKTRYSYLCWPLFFMKQSLTNSFNFEKFSATDIVKILEILIHDICFVWWACFSIHSWHFLWVPTVLLFSPILSFIASLIV
jgi:hypothetical protein